MHPRDWQLGLSWRCHADWTTESTTTTGVSAEEYDPEDSKTTPEVSAEDLKGTTRPGICGKRQRLQRRDDGPEEFATTTEVSSEEDDTKELKTTADASEEEAE